MPFFGPKHPRGSRRKPRPMDLRLEPLEERLTPSQGGVGMSLAAAQAAGPFSFTTLNSFNGANGAVPNSPLVEDAQGNLFGTTTQGGVKQQGTIYVIPAGTRYIGAMTFFNPKHGAAPGGSLFLDPQDNIIGTTARGGASNKGTVFAFANGSSVVTKLTSFGRGVGATPTSGLTAGGQGNLYGTTRSGGAYGAGTVFYVSASAGPVRTLASFSRSDGANPNGALLYDSHGDLFGTTYAGGTHGQGTVFEIVAGSTSITTLASFNGNNGAHPLGPLTIDAAGNLYGTTTTGGAAGKGTVFELAAGNGKITRLASFQNGTGQKPTSALVRDAAGDLIGTAQLGGADGKGTIFELAAGSSSITPLVVFSGANGARPTGSLMVDTQGNIIGTTARGGQYNKGTVFALTPGT